MKIEYAIMINTRLADTSLPEIGLFNSSLALVTGRPGYYLQVTGTGLVTNPYFGEDEITFDVAGLGPGDLPLSFEIVGSQPEGAPINPVTGLSQLRWKEGVISQEALGSPIEVMDPTLGGGYSTMSVAGLVLMNNLPGLDGRTLFQFLEFHGIDLFRCDMQIFAVIDGVFTKWSEPQIEKLVDAEHFVTVESFDSFLKIHKDVLKTEVKEDVFPEAPEDSRTKFIPLVIGRVPEAELFPLTGQVVFQNITKTGEVEYQAAPILKSGADGVQIRIRNSMNFSGGDSRLVGKFAKVIRVAGEKADVPPRRINGVSKSGADIVMSLSASFEIGQAPEYDPPYELGWWIYVYTLSGFGAVSDTPVHEITTPLLGYENENFVNIEGRRVASYPDADGPFPYAGVAALPEGSYANLIPDYGFILGLGTPVRGAAKTSAHALVPDVVKNDGGGVIGDARDIYENTPVAIGAPGTPTVRPGVTSPYPGIGSELPVISSRVEGTDHYQRVSEFLNVSGWTSGSQSPSLFDSIEIDMSLPEGLLLDEDESLAVAIDADFVGNFVGMNSQIRMRAWASAYLIGVDDRLSSVPATTVIFGGTDDDDLIIFDGNGGADSHSLRMCGEYYYTGEGSDSSAVELIQGAIDLASMLRNPDTRATVKGIRLRIITEFAQNGNGLFTGARTWQCGHKLYQAVIYRKRDNYEGEKFVKVTGVEFGGTWGGRKTATDPVLSIPDAIEYLIRERDGSTAINTDSFDLCLARRPAVYWHIGRQITEQAETLKGNPGTTKDLIAELCKTAFLSIVPGRDKNRRLINLEGYAGATEEITDIIDGSMGEGRVVGLDRVYTGCEYKYDKNPATGEYRSSVFIRKTSEDAFPGPAELVPGTTTLLYTTYAGGFGGDYPTALTVWERYHAAFVLTQRENYDKLELDWCQSNARLGLDTSIPDVPVFLALIRSEWYSVPRKQYTFKVPVNAANLARLLGDRIVFRDIKRTGNLYYFAIVEEQTLITRENQLQIKVSHKLNDEGFAESPVPHFITEVIGGDTITETIGGDTITEVVN